MALYRLIRSLKISVYMYMLAYMKDITRYYVGSRHQNMCEFFNAEHLAKIGPINTNKQRENNQCTDSKC